MSRLALVASAVMLAACASAFNIEKVFTIPLPAGPSQSEFVTGLGGNMYYTVGTGGKLFAVNLTSKSVEWTKEFDGSVIGSLFATSTQVLVGTNGQTTISLKAESGDLNWLSDEFNLDSYQTNSLFTKEVNGHFYVINNYQGEFFTIDLMTGTASSPIEIQGGAFSGNEAIVVAYSDSTFEYILRAYDLTTNTLKWTNNYGITNLLAINDKYIVVSNTTEDDASVIDVLDANTQMRLHQFKDVNGINNNMQFFPPVVDGDLFVAVIGYDQQRLTGFDLKTGTKLWSKDYDNNGGDTATGTVINGALVTITGTDLQFVNLTTGDDSKKVKGVPSSPSGTLNSFGSLIQIPNLQGYTLFSDKGVYAGRNEMAPNANGFAGYSWIDGITVSTQGASVVGEKVNA